MSVENYGRMRGTAWDRLFATMEATRKEAAGRGLSDELLAELLAEMRAERHVVDSDVLISALLQPRGRTAEVLAEIRARGGVLLFSEETFAELASRLLRPKFDRYVDQATRQRFLAELAGLGSGSRSRVRCAPVVTPRMTSSARRQSTRGRPPGYRRRRPPTLDPFQGVCTLTPRDFLETARSAGRA
jgi:hypothetical protein